MPGCSALYCRNSSTKGYRMFRFPKEEDRLKKWLQNCRRQSIMISECRLCEVHFDESQFEKNRLDGWKKLKPNAVPTLFDVSNRASLMPRKRLKKYLPVLKEPVFICDVCQAKFGSPENLLDHKNSMSVYSCHICDALFHTAHEVGEHVCKEPTGEDESYILDGTFEDVCSEKTNINNNNDSTTTEDHSKECNKTSDVIKHKKSPHPIIVYLLSKTSRTGPNSFESAEMNGSQQQTPPSKEENVPFRCKHCKNSFYKERHFIGHKCMAKGDYIDLSEKDHSYETNTSGHLSEDSHNEVIRSRESDLETYYCDDSNDEDYTDEEKEIDISEEEESLEEETSLKVESLDKENEPVLNSFLQGEDVSKRVSESKDVPVFSTEEERLAFEKHLDDVDLSVVDHMFSRELKTQITPSGRECRSSEYVCNICKRVFGQTFKARLHCLTHTEMKPFRCPQCEFCCNVKATLYMHMRTHTGNYFTCCYCNFKTVYERGLVEHEIMHTSGEQKCKLCSRRYSLFRGLLKHIKDKHQNYLGRQYRAELQRVRSEVITKRHECHICKRRFKSRINRDRHMSAHDITNPVSGFNCGLCSFSTIKRALLENHYRKHRLVYVCCICHNLYQSSILLKEHLKKHTLKKDTFNILSDVMENSSDRTDIEGVVEIRQLCSTAKTTSDASSASSSHVTVFETPDISSATMSVPTTTTSVFSEPSTITSEPPDATENMSEHADVVSAVSEIPSTVVFESINPVSSTSESLDIASTSSDLSPKEVHAKLPNTNTDDSTNIETLSKLAQEQPQTGTAAHDDQSNTSKVSMLENNFQSEVSADASVSSLFSESLECSWYLPEEIVPFFSKQYVNICDDLLEKDTGLENATEGSKGEIGSSREIPADDVQKASVLPPDVSHIIPEMYKPLNVDVYKKIREAFGELECLTCGKFFHTDTELELHIAVHKGDKPHKCDKCNYSAVTKETLKHHQEAIHEGRTYPCDQCDFVALSNASLRRHKRQHVKFDGKCPICKKEISTWKLLGIHITTEHPGCDRSDIRKLTGSYPHVLSKLGNLSYKCPYCSQIFRKSVDIQNHVWLHEGTKPFQCPHCEHQAISKARLALHLQSHSSERPYMCESCGKDFKTKMSLKVHYRSMHENVFYNCDKCDFVTRHQSHLIKHRKSHEKELFKCDKCDYSTYQKFYYRVHMEAHEGKSIFSCDKCDYKTNLKYRLKRHKEMHDGKILYSCDKCDYDATQKVYLRTHMGIHEGKIVYSCEKCDYCANEEPRFDKHVQSHNTQVYTCDRCNFSATIQSHLTKHILQIHERKQNFKCRKCGYKTELKTEFKKHMAAHKGIKLFCCDKCDYTTTHKRWNLLRHMELHEKDVFQCDKCSYTAPNKYQFKKHMSTHTMKLLYCCYRCDFSATERNTLKAHLEARGSGESPYSCDRCDYCTDQKSLFKKHMDVHEAKQLYSCDKCDYGTNKKCLLRKHILEVHKGKVLFKCDKCNYSSIQKALLNRHMEMHNLGQKLACEHCDYTCATITYMKAHYIVKHKEETFNDNIFSMSSGLSGQEPSINLMTPEQEVEKMFKCLTCSFIFEKGEDLKEHLQMQHELSLDNVDFNTEDGIQVEILTEGEAGTNDTGDQLPSENQDAQMVQLQESNQPSEGVFPVAYQTVQLTEMDESMTSEADLVQQIMEQDTHEPQHVTLQTLDAEGQLIAVTPEAIVGAENTNEPYVIQYVTYDLNEAQDDAQITVKEEILEATW